MGFDPTINGLNGQPVSSNERVIPKSKLLSSTFFMPGAFFPRCEPTMAINREDPVKAAPQGATSVLGSGEKLYRACWVESTAKRLRHHHAFRSPPKHCGQLESWGGAL